ncbi:MAG: LCP family protein [Aquihabitans sp.]
MESALPPRPPRRTLGQRMLLVAGGLLATVVLLVAGVVAWAGYKINQIDREDVVLDTLVANGPANYLIVGSDSRSGDDPDNPGSTGDGRAALADTIMVLRVDPGATTAQVLSLPRDLWVTMPDGENGRINAAYAEGPQALIDTLRTELDIPINHYVEVDFRGFQELVGAIDGVPMWFDRAMRDTNSGLDVLHPGCVVLDGQSALAFARARHLQYWQNGGFTYDGTGDLGRISRQQVFLRRVIDRAASKGMSNPLTLKALVDVGASHLTIDTQLPVSDLTALGRRFSSFDSDDLQTFTIPVTGRTTSGGAQVVELDPAGADAVLDKFRNVDPEQADSSTTVARADSTPLSDDDLADPSSVTVTVLNSSDEQGLAATMADTLADEGFTVAAWGNGADAGHPRESETVIRYPAGSERDARTVAVVLAEHGSGALLKQDATVEGVVVFLGDDLIVASGSTSATATVPDSTSSTVAPSTTTTVPVGMIPGDPPAGSSCG